ncbi:MAG: 4Fe-4S ferredoxin [Bdellovibrionales bacterium RIFOXYD1_FULL_44_7]|nr:MAG: 4Fe-4S ferredoxin [Bdellovibrionales bacterium RIFOXYD1_FULL_44_7]
MAYKINDECSSCGACEPECPNNAISQGDTVYMINADLCTECVGAHDTPQCASVCPTESCVADPQKNESEEALLVKAKKLHPTKDFSGNVPSHFKK